jgi:ribosomal protein L7/L12
MNRVTTLFAVFGLSIGLFFGEGSAVLADSAQQANSSDLDVVVDEVIKMSIGNCGSSAARTVSISIAPGTFSSCKLTVNIGTNAEGYKLFINSVDTLSYHVSNSGLGEDLTNNYFDGVANSVTNLVRIVSEPPVVKDTTQLIPPLSASVSAPTDMSGLGTPAWGFAVPNTQGSNAAFDASYASLSNTTSATGKYAGVPAAQTEIRARTGQVNSQNTDVFFGSFVTTAVATGTYKATVLFSAIGEAPSTTGGSGNNDVGTTNQIDGQTITRQSADVGTGSYSTHETTYPDTSDGSPEGSSPAGVSRTRTVAASNSAPTTESSLVVGIPLLAVLAWLGFVLFGKKYDVLLLSVGAQRHKIAEVIKRYTKLTASDKVLYEVFEQMSSRPLVLVEKISKLRANKLVKALQQSSAEAKIRAHRKHKN